MFSCLALGQGPQGKVEDLPTLQLYAEWSFSPSLAVRPYFPRPYMCQLSGHILPFEAVVLATPTAPKEQQQHFVVVFLWQVVHEFSEESKRKLLKFATGSDRAPIQGLGSSALVSQRHLLLCVCVFFFVPAKEVRRC